MYKQELISVIVPIYKVEKYLSKCIESIINQEYRNLEIILIDDGSPDNCGKICDKYANIDSRIKVVHKKNGGVSESRNIGINISKGDYITFIDSDDYVTKEHIQNLYNILKKFNTKISTCGVVKFYEGKEIIKLEGKEIINEEITTEETLKRIINDTICDYPVNKLFKKKLWNDIRFPLGKRYEDVSTIYKLIYKADKIAYSNLDTYYYLYGRDGAATSTPSKQNLIDNLQAYYIRDKFIKENFNNISDYAKASYIKHTISVIEKICVYDYVDLFNDELINKHYNHICTIINEVDKNVLNEILDYYRLTSLYLLIYDIHEYRRYIKQLYNIRENKKK